MTWNFYSDNLILEGPIIEKVMHKLVAQKGIIIWDLAEPWIKSRRRWTNVSFKKWLTTLTGFFTFEQKKLYSILNIRWA